MKKLGKGTYRKNTALSEDEFRKKFSTETKARKYFEKEIWNGKPKCPFCGSIQTSVWKPSNGQKGWYRCNHRKCHKEFTVRKGTVMESSRIPLRKWLLASYYIVTSRKGISGLELSKKLGICQKSAWFLHHRIRFALDVGNFSHLLGGLGEIVELDETYGGGRNRNRHADKKIKGSGPAGKAVIFGMAERNGRKKAFVVSNAERETLWKVINQHVRKNTLLSTDEARQYKFSMPHLPKYVAESVFRLNEGHCKYLTMDRVNAIANYCIGKRLTWAQCVGES